MLLVIVRSRARYYKLDVRGEFLVQGFKLLNLDDCSLGISCINQQGLVHSGSISEISIERCDTCSF
jgi:hypothetical protein